MTIDKTGGAAFPKVPDEIYNGSDGMALRDYFAGRAMHGMLAHATRYKPRLSDASLHWHAAMVKEAYEIADAMIKAREAE